MVSVTFFKVGGKLGFVQGVCLQTFPFKGAYSLFVSYSIHFLDFLLKGILFQLLYVSSFTE